MKTFYTRKQQPHFQHIGGIFSITLMTHDAVPRVALTALQEERYVAINQLPADLPEWQLSRAKSEIHIQFEEKLEQLLHAKNTQEHPFRNPEVAEIIIDQVKKYDNEYYSIEALCVMSNHIHLLLNLATQVPEGWDGIQSISSYKNVGEILRLIKGGISYRVNKIYKRDLSIWSYGYYDRYIRSPKHFEYAYFYIINNPVKAGIVEHWQEYPYTVCKS